MSPKLQVSNFVNILCAMSVKYRKRKIVLQFDKENPLSKYVATNVLIGSIGYNKLCDEVNQRTGMHRGVVDVVLKGVQDTMISFLEEGFSVKLGEFGSFRPAIQAKSQDKEEDVDSDTISRVKIIFTPGNKFQQMLNGVSIESVSNASKGGEGDKEGANGSDDGPGGEAPDPAI